MKSRINREWQAYISENFGENVLAVFRCCVDELTGPQVADKMGMAENTCYVYKLRVQKSLHKEIMRLEFEFKE